MVDKWILAGKVNSSSYRSNVLIKLQESPKTPTQLSKILNIKISHISRALKELSDLGLIKSLTPELRKSKMYAITPLGKQIINQLETYKS